MIVFSINPGFNIFLDIVTQISFTFLLTKHRFGLSMSKLRLPVIQDLWNSPVRQQQQLNVLK